jgi:hypothetical protein
MAIKIKTLEQVASTYTDQQGYNGGSYVYSDLALDMEQHISLSNGYPYKTGSDIKVDYDTLAIRNSITNLFNTLPGQRFLFPDYGLDLRQHLFTQITQSNALAIGSQILNVITKYEPRVSVVNVNVEADPDHNRYNISIILNFPTLNTTDTVNYILNTKNQNFTIIPSKNL